LKNRPSYSLGEEEYRPPALGRKNAETKREEGLFKKKEERG
jgi:hypothetical protein